jgi:hypothetical protein
VLASNVVSNETAMDINTALEVPVNMDPIPTMDATAILSLPPSGNISFKNFAVNAPMPLPNVNRGAKVPPKEKI